MPVWIVMVLAGCFLTTASVRCFGQEAEPVPRFNSNP